MIGRLRSEAGQALVLTTLFMTVLLGATAMAVDVGSWYTEQRRAQAAADAAALAGANVLPQDGTQAVALAQTYADSNGGGVEAGGIALTAGFGTNDTITVKISRNAPGFFSKIFSIDSVQVHAKAAARAGTPDEARWAAPIVVNKLHPLLSGAGCPCFDTPTTLPLGKTGAPGAFALVNLDLANQGSIGASTIADWLLHGFNAYLPLGLYFSDPGAAWNNSQIQGAINARIGTELLFPVYDVLAGNGSNATYHVIGWVGFMITGVTASGTSGSISGQFTRVVWDGIQNSTGSTGVDYGVRTINLVN
jgi:Putative Flp pilus-assembly TadE/G-like